MVVATEAQFEMAVLADLVLVVLRVVTHARDELQPPKEGRQWNARIWPSLSNILKSIGTGNDFCELR